MTTYFQRYVKKIEDSGHSSRNKSLKSFAIIEWQLLKIRITEKLSCNSRKLLNKREDFTESGFYLKPGISVGNVVKSCKIDNQRTADLYR